MKRSLSLNWINRHFFNQLKKYFWDQGSQTFFLLWILQWSRYDLQLTIIISEFHSFISHYQRVYRRGIPARNIQKNTKYLIILSFYIQNNNIINIFNAKIKHSSHLFGRRSMLKSLIFRNCSENFLIIVRTDWPC